MRKENSFRIPLYSVTIIVFCLVTHFGGFSDVFIFDRVLISQGEIWRLFTSNCVHYTIYHLTTNMIILAVVGFLIEQKSKSIFLLMVILVILFNGMVLFYYAKEFDYYAGSSAINYALITYLLFLSLMDLKKYQFAFWLSLIILGVAVFVVINKYHVVSFYGDGDCVKTAYLAHLVGVLVGFIAFLLLKLIPVLFIKNQYTHKSGN